MRFLLDTNIVVAASLGVGAALRARMKACDEGDLVTSAVAYAEAVYGLTRGKPPTMERLAAFVEIVPVLPFDDAAARTYATLPFRRGGYDRLIAAHALSIGVVLVTDNARDFADVPGLAVQNWMTA